MTAEAAVLIEGWASAAAPPPDYTVSEWADAERFLPTTSGAQGARWRTDAVPYLRGIMNSVHEHGVSTIALEKCSQVGGSEALHNIIGYHMKHRPCAMLFVHPTAGVADEWSKDRLADMLRSTPALGAVVRDKRQPRGSHEAESTLSLKVFPNGFLAIGGANTPNTFARRSVRIAIGDDVDRFPAVVGEEGDPAELLTNRTETFYDGLSIFVSTPTLKGGRIDTLFQRSDQRRYFVRCLGCERWDYITWNDPTHLRVAFDERDPETARLQCPDEDHGGCGAHLYEADRRVMIGEGDWRPTATAKDAGLIGFHLPAMLSTIGARTLPNLVEKFLAAREKGKEATRVFINTQLAEGWEDRGARMDAHVLHNRREAYGPEGEFVEVPRQAAALTAGVDVQENRFELQVLAWGPAGERWVVDWRSIPGSPKNAETRHSLLQALSRKYQHATGHLLPIHATCIDSGFETDEVYDFVLAHQARRIYATKGIAGRTGEPIVGKPAEKRYGKSPRPVRVWPINVDDAKKDVMDSLDLKPGADGRMQVGGPNAMHFPAHLDTIDEEYFAQLCAEHKETRYNKQHVATHVVWVKDRERNEALDTAVLAYAAYKLLNPNIRQMLAILGATAVPRPEPAGETTPPAGGNAPAPPSPPARPRRRSAQMRMG